MSTTKKVPLQASIQALVDLFNQGISNSAEAILTNFEALGVSRTHVSLVAGVQPAGGSIDTNTLGAYLKADGTFQGLQWNGSAWVDYDIFLNEADDVLDPTKEKVGVSGKAVADYLYQRDERLYELATAEAFTISGNAVYEDGSLISASIVWIDGTGGSLEVLSFDDFGASEIRYEKANRYLLLEITRGQTGDVTTTSITFGDIS